MAVISANLASRKIVPCIYLGDANGAAPRKGPFKAEIIQFPVASPRQPFASSAELLFALGYGPMPENAKKSPASRAGLVTIRASPGSRRYPRADRQVPERPPWRGLRLQPAASRRYRYRRSGHHRRDPGYAARLDHRQARQQRADDLLPLRR